MEPQASFFLILAVLQPTLKLPYAFGDKHGDKLPEWARVVNTQGATWRIKVERETEDDDGAASYWFTRGWPKFCKDMELKPFEALMFGFHHDKNFGVVIFGENGVKRVPPALKPNTATAKSGNNKTTAVVKKKGPRPSSDGASTSMHPPQTAHTSTAKYTFYTTMTATVVRPPHYVNVPARIWKSIRRKNLDVKLTMDGRIWETKFVNHRDKKYFWAKSFVEDNDLQEGGSLQFTVEDFSVEELHLSVVIRHT